MRISKMKINIKKILFILMLCISMSGFAVNSNAALSQIEFTSMQAYNGAQLGENYYTWHSGSLSGTSSYAYCIDLNTGIPIPGNFLAQEMAITGSGWEIYNAGSPRTLSQTELLKAAWLIDNYGYSKKGLYGGYDAATIGGAVQMAIWSVTGQALGAGQAPLDYYTLANAMITSVNAVAAVTDLSYLKSKYAILDIRDSADPTIKLQSQLTPVPIPPTVWLLGAGLMGIGFIRRRVSSK
jgi:hypothetical protein